MTDYYKDRRYFVYRHVAPNGKMYIGITSKSDPKQRWLNDGSGYESNRHFWNAIQKYGWENFQHIIVAHGLPVDTACRLEAYLITKYDTMINGYNQTSGGVRPTEVTDEIRSIISKKVKEHRKSLPAGAWSAKFKGHRHSEVTKRKISAKALGRKYSREVITKRVATFKANMTEERRKMYRSYSQGRVVSKATREKLSKINKGKHISLQTKQILSAKAIKRHIDNDYIWVHKYNIESLISSQNLYDYLDQGYEVGRSNIKNKYIHKGNQTKKVAETELDFYLSRGWVRGYGDSRHAKVAASKRKYIYNYKGMIFYSGEAIADYLRNNGYPKIVQGTINEICRGKVFLAYPELNKQINRKNMNENS